MFHEEGRSSDFRAVSGLCFAAKTPSFCIHHGTSAFRWPVLSHKTSPEPTVQRFVLQRMSNDLCFRQLDYAPNAQGNQYDCKECDVCSRRLESTPSHTITRGCTFHKEYIVWKNMLSTMHRRSVKRSNSPCKER